MHTFGRPDIACKLALFAEQQLKGKAKTGASDALLYYKKILSDNKKLDL